MAVGVLIGGLMQFLVQMPLLKRKGFRWSPVLSFRDPEFRRVMALFVPVAVGLAGTRINVLVNTILVTPLAEGSVSWLNYAFRIMHLPLGLFGVAVGAVALPSLSKLVVEGDTAAIRGTLTDSLKMVLFLTIPTSALLVSLAVPVTRAIYERGHFTAADTLATAAALVLYVLGIPFMSALRNVAAVFYAHKDAKTPMYASFASIGLNIVLNVTLMWVIGYLAFPLSTALAAILNVAILYALLPRKVGPMELGPLAAYAGKLAAASAAGGGVAWLGNRLVAGELGVSFLATVASLGVAGLAGLAVFFAASCLLGIKETSDYLRRFLRK
jgi:putative peptidoglycan lipid II flippase